MDVNTKYCNVKRCPQFHSLLRAEFTQFRLKDERLFGFPDTQYQLLPCSNEVDILLCEWAFNSSFHSLTHKHIDDMCLNLYGTPIKNSSFFLAAHNQINPKSGKHCYCSSSVQYGFFFLYSSIHETFRPQNMALHAPLNVWIIP